MEIRKVQQKDGVELVATGRLDEYWSSHLASVIDETIRGGAHRLRLNMAGVTYLSSAGIRILLQYYKQLQEIQGSFAVTEPSAFVRKILDMTRLSGILIREPVAAGAPPTVAPRRTGRMIERGGALFEVLDYAAGGSFQCSVVGDPARLEHGGFAEADLHKVSFPEGALGLGLGAFGSDFADCRNRFGEFLAVAGSAAYLPTDGSNVPDYLLSAGSFVPEVNVLYGIVCEGQFASLARFEAGKDTRGVKLSAVVESALEIAGADSAALVVVAEAAGLVGAALRQSPAKEKAMAAAIFGHPEIRNWISFTAEPAYAGSVCLLAGIVARGPQPRLASIIRGSSHLHAAAFHYRPIQKGEIDLRSTVKSLFETQGLQGVLHLLHDRREASGAGETELIRGAAWVGPIAEVL
jgi:anti-anti-sigma factor